MVVPPTPGPTRMGPGVTFMYGSATTIMHNGGNVRRMDDTKSPEKLRVVVLLDPMHADELKRLAKTDGMPMSTFARMLIIRGLRDYYEATHGAAK